MKLKQPKYPAWKLALNDLIENMRVEHENVVLKGTAVDPKSKSSLSENYLESEESHS